MPLQDTDVTLVSRDATNANASMAQVKDYVLGGLNATNSLVWSAHPATANNQISSPNIVPDEDHWVTGIITSIVIPASNFSVYDIGDVIVLQNIATSGAGCYRITDINTNARTLNVQHLATAHVGRIDVGDRISLINLGPDVDTDTGNEVFVQDLQPTTAENGDLWYQPTTGLFHVFNGTWERINSYNGPYYQNAVDDLGIDNTGATDVSADIRNALIHMFDQVPQQPVLDYDGQPTGEMEDAPGAVGTLYFPAGIYLLENPVVVYTEASKKRASWVIKGDGTSTKFYVRNDQGGFAIIFLNKDNYLTVQDLAIHPKQVVNGYGLFLQNGNTEEASNPPDVDTDDNDLETQFTSPAGGSNQQYGVQIINVNILSDEDKPNDELKKSNAFFFKYNLSLVNFGRPRLERVICWNHAERSHHSLANPTGIDYSGPHEWSILVDQLDEDGRPIRDENGDKIKETLTGTHDGYGFKPEDEARILSLTNCYSPWVDNCYFNGTARYGIYWNSSRSNTEGGTFSKLVINGADIGFWVAQLQQDTDDNGDPLFKRDEDGNLILDANGNPIPVMKQGRHPHLTVIDSHINAARFGIHLNNIKYFHIADILFYARNDKKRDVTLIDCQLINCHSGILANGYSGGALGNTEKKAIPENETYDFSGMTADERAIAEKDSLAKSPSRIHVKLIGTDDIDRPAGIQKNRGILIKDNNLNAYMCRTDSSNRTAGRVKENGQPVAFNNVDWVPPYQVEGPCEDINIYIPPACFAGSDKGTYDNSQYPPDFDMVTSRDGPVHYVVAGFKDCLISDGTAGDKYQRQRLELKNKNPKDGDDITDDTYKANVVKDGKKKLSTFVSIRTTAETVEDGKEDGSITISKMRNGNMKQALQLKDQTAYFPIHDVTTDPMISFNIPGQNTKPGIYYLEGGQPNSVLNDARPGSLCLKNNGTLWFKTEGASNGWKQVELKE